MLKAYAYKIVGIEKCHFLVAKDITTALDDAIKIAGKNNNVYIVEEIGDSIHIDFERENKAIKKEYGIKD